MSVPLPPSYDLLHRHTLLPAADHDESARMNFLANMNAHIGAVLFPGVPAAFEAHSNPAFKKEHGREPLSSVEVRDAIKPEPAYQIWSALRRNTQESRQQVGREFVFRRLPDFI